MPRKITAYHCDYCKKVTVTKKAILWHEAHCYWNPEYKACLTCKNLIQHNADSDYMIDGEWVNFDCKADNLLASTKRNQYGMRVNCKKWKIKLMESVT